MGGTMLDGRRIDYEARIQGLPRKDLDSIVRLFTGEIVEAWCRDYLLHASSTAYLLRVKDCGFEYIFDHASAALAKVDRSSPHDRVVAVFGRSMPTTETRDASRMKGFIGKSSELGDKTDKGHLMSHGAGGGLDINLYPQRRDFNQRRKSNPRSYVYYDMEKYTREHPGCFFFNRPLYADLTWRPVVVEFGIVRPDGSLWVEAFDNT